MLVIEVEGFGSLGMEPLDLLKAVRLPTEELDQATRHFPHPKLDKEAVEGPSAAARRGWAKRYAGWRGLAKPGDQLTSGPGRAQV